MIACYKCNAACAHCMYGCSPYLDDEYITEENAARFCEKVRRLGCRGMHIGGGEPFLNADGLVKLINAMKKSGVEVDYVETNGDWVSGDKKRDLKIINEVMSAGGNCIMVSADFFHVEFIPFRRTKYLIDLLESEGIYNFVWQRRFLSALDGLDPKKKYSRGDLINELGYDAVSECAREYGMGFNGRALNLLRLIGRCRDHGDFLSAAPCENLTNSGHFHVDLYGRYVPPGCTGMGIDLNDLGKKIAADAYPVVSRLFYGGLKELFIYAVSRGFEPGGEGYVSKCELCFSMRKYLAENEPESHPDLNPKWYYKQDF